MTEVYTEKLSSKTLPASLPGNQTSAGHLLSHAQECVRRAHTICHLSVQGGDDKVFNCLREISPDGRDGNEDTHSWSQGNGAMLSPPPPPL